MSAIGITFGPCRSLDLMLNGAVTDIARPAPFTTICTAKITSLALLLLYLYVLAARYDDLPYTFFRLQDRYVAGCFVLVLAAWSLFGKNRFEQAFRTTYPPSLTLAAALVWVLGLWAGAHLIMDNFALTRDEHMVQFDMGVFRAGRLATPLPVAWRPYAEALVPHFLLDIPDHAGLVSSYMPLNAAMHAAFARLADPALLNPLLAGFGLAALYDVARQLFGNDREVRTIILLLYVTSAQLIVAAMTDYAMTGHLAFNLIWLALFMRNSKLSHVAALVIGFLATGLHQVVFHPLFVAPFILHLWGRGEWRTALFYALGYLAIGLFWLSYPHMVVLLGGFSSGGAPGTAAGPLTFITTRVVPLLVERDPAGLVIMVLNLLRFSAWQNLALLPLALLALPLARSNQSIVRPLYYGILLTLLVMFVLMPFQGHGWGYRYFHGLIGSFVLLAGYGWQTLGEARRPARSLLRVAMIVTIAIAIPLILWTSHAFVHPYARVDAAVGRIQADFVILDTEPVPFAIDEVRNPADLSARPIRLASEALNESALRNLCSRGTVAFVSRGDMQTLGLGLDHPSASPRFKALRNATPASCAVVPVTFH